MRPERSQAVDFRAERRHQRRSDADHARRIGGLGGERRQCRARIGVGPKFEGHVTREAGDRGENAGLGGLHGGLRVE